MSVRMPPEALDASPPDGVAPVGADDLYLTDLTGTTDLTRVGER